MKKTIKKIVCPTLCAVMLLCMAVPALALTGSENYSYVDTGIGVRVTCESKLTLIKATSKLTLSFEENLAHFPEEDYSCFTTLLVNFSDGTSQYQVGTQYNLSSSVSIPLNLKTAKKSIHKYYLFSLYPSDLIYTKVFM